MISTVILASIPKNAGYVLALRLKRNEAYKIYMRIENIFESENYLGGKLSKNKNVRINEYIVIFEVIENIKKDKFIVDMTYDSIYVGGYVNEKGQRINGYQNEAIYDIMPDFLKKNKLRTILTSNWLIEDITNFNELKIKFSTEFLDSMEFSDWDNRIYKKEIETAFKITMFQFAFQKLFIYYPKSPIQKDSQWNYKDRISFSFMKINLPTNISVTSITEDEIELSHSANITGKNMDMEETAQHGFKEYQVNGKREGFIKIDNNNGMIKNMKIIDNYSGYFISNTGFGRVIPKDKKINIGYQNLFTFKCEKLEEVK